MGEVDSLFPFEDYRPHQREALIEAANALWGDDQYENVVLNLPTGVGKSPINTTLAQMADSAFMTTPQKKLRDQLENDEDLNGYYSTLRGREDYDCGHSDTNCKECPVNNDQSRRCAEHPRCTYWNAKVQGMDAQTAVVTFAYLRIDGLLPVYSDREQISFNDRELLVVDECHSLASQVSSLFAGFTVSPYQLPESVYGRFGKQVDDDAWLFAHVKPALEGVYQRSREREEKAKRELKKLEYKQNQWERKQRRNPTINDCSEGGDEESPYKDKIDSLSSEIGSCSSFNSKYEWAREQVSDGRAWVVNVETVTKWGEVFKSVSVSPVDVDEYLQKFAWSRAEKRVLSSATIPYSDNPDRWIRHVGLDPGRTKVIQKPMPFPSENRPIRTDTIIGKFSSGGIRDYWDEIAETLHRLSSRHTGEKGLVHTVSYDRAERLNRRLDDLAVLHERPSKRDHDDDWYINRWQQSKADILLSPSLTDGVDLPDDMCRWQVLLKAPKPGLSDSRTRYMTEIREDWDWYDEMTLQAILQAAGRGVRHMDDECVFYVLDSDFKKVVSSASTPSWFRETITNGA